jgi:hypothetical protein
MVTAALIAYIRAELQKGKTPDALRIELTNAGGWTMNDVAEAFKAVDLAVAAAAATSGATTTQSKPIHIVRPHKQVRLLWVVILVLLAGYAGWWIRDRQQFLQFPIPFVQK